MWERAFIAIAIMLAVSVARRCLAYFVRTPTGGALSSALPIR